MGMVSEPPRRFDSETQPSADAQARLLNSCVSAAWYAAKYLTPDRSAESARHFVEQGQFCGFDPSPYLSVDHLRTKYPPLYLDVVSPIALFFSTGIKERCNPSFWFNDYQRAVSSAKFRPALNDRLGLIARDEVDFDPYLYVLSAITMGIADSPIFMPSHYLEKSPDVTSSGLNAHHHFLIQGQREWRDCSPAFRFVRSLPDIQKLLSDMQATEESTDDGSDPLIRLIVSGHANEIISCIDQLPYFVNDAGNERPTHDPFPPKINPSGPIGAVAAERTLAESVVPSAAIFDAPYYLEFNKDVKEAGMDPFHHYERFGEREGRRPNPDFDPLYYSNVYADVRTAGISPFQHYKNFGRFENRLPSQPLQASRATGRSTVLFVGHDSYAAGSQRVLLEVIRWFHKHTKYEIKILLLGPGHLTSEYARLGSCYTVSDLAEEVPLIVEDLLEQRAPDLVYCNTVISGRIFASKLSRFLSGSVVMAHCHEMQKILNEFPAEFTLLKERADGWICASSPIEEYLVIDGGVERNKITTVPAFIAPIGTPEAILVYRDRLRDTLSIPAAATIVAGCGTLYWRKDPALFVATAVELLRKKATADFHFLWIGDGPDTEMINQQIQASGFAKFFHFVGRSDDAVSSLAAADILFLSSVEDPFPLVVLEAGQFGVPAVCFKGSTGMEKLFASGTGTIIELRTATAAATAISALILDAKRRDELGQAMKAAVLSTYTTTAQMPFVMAKMYAAGLEPGVSIIVPNYNHERFLKLRLGSILEQSFQDFEVIILDDCSIDKSLLVIGRYLKDPRVALYENDKNSGAVFAQWRKGVGLARSELIWIAESDDWCEANMLEKLLDPMQNGDVNLSFCRSEIADENDTVKANALRPYLDRLQPDFGTTDFKMDGAEFVNWGYGAISVVVNASGAVLRKSSVMKALPVASKFKMCGDWIIYLQCCSDGSVAYTVGTANYFRRHPASTVHKIEGSDLYFSERLEVAQFVLEQFSVSKRLRHMIGSELKYEENRFRGIARNQFGLDIERLIGQPIRPEYLSRTKHVCFYVHGLMFSKGGIERLFALLSRHLLDTGFAVTVVCKPSQGGAPIYDLRSAVSVRQMDIEQEQGRRDLRLMLIEERVDVFIPMLSEWLFDSAIDACYGLGVPIIASEHNDPEEIEKRWWSKEKRASAFRKCDAIHLLSAKYRDSLPNDLKARSRIIPNPVMPQFFDVVRKTSQKIRIIAAGRLEEQKRFDLLIAAFALLPPHLGGCELIIFGNGTLRPALEDLVTQLGVQARVSLPGVTSALPFEMARSDVFVLPSAFEGLPLTLIEAMAAGLPSIAFARCKAAADIIVDNVNGFLVSDFTAAGLAFVLERALKDPGLLNSMSSQARQNAAKFELERIANEWDTFIRQTIEC